MRIQGLMHVIKWTIIAIACLCGIYIDRQFFAILIIPASFELVFTLVLLSSDKEFYI